MICIFFIFPDELHEQGRPDCHTSQRKNTWISQRRPMFETRPFCSKEMCGPFMPSFQRGRMSKKARRLFEGSHCNAAECSLHEDLSILHIKRPNYLVDDLNTISRHCEFLHCSFSPSSSLGADVSRSYHNSYRYAALKFSPRQQRRLVAYIARTRGPAAGRKLSELMIEDAEADGWFLGNTLEAIQITAAYMFKIYINSYKQFF